MNENKTTALVRAFDRAYINGKFVTPHGTMIGISRAPGLRSPGGGVKRKEGGAV
jgi:hypothetical protein